MSQKAETPSHGSKEVMVCNALVSPGLDHLPNPRAMTVACVCEEFLRWRWSLLGLMRKNIGGMVNVASHYYEYKARENDP